MGSTDAIRSILAREKTTIMPAVGDPFTACLAKAEGFEVVMVSGNATSAMRLGLPDVGLLTMTEAADVVRRIADSSGLAAIADVDTGYGDHVTVRRTMREFEGAGAAGVMMEDQVSPKRCAMLAGKAVIPTAEMVDKIKAALDARRDPKFVFLARTDAAAVEGLSAAIDRAGAYAEAGADAIFVEGPRTLDEARRLTREIALPQLFNVTPSGSTARPTIDELSQMGFKLLSFSVYLILMAIPAMRGMLRELRATGSIDAAVGGAAGLDEYLAILDYDRWNAPGVASLDRPEGVR